MKNSHIRIAVILGSISIVGIVVFQLYWVNKSFDLAEQQFNKTVEIALYNVAEKMATFNDHQMPNENPVRQISSSYFIVDINDIIDASVLDHYLKSEFEYRNIKIGYEYAIYDCETDRMVFGSYFDPEAKQKNKTQKFQKYDEFTYYFGIIFPNKEIYILKTMNLWIISTFVLVTALIFFAYAMFIILRQKRLSEIQKDFINNMTHEFKTPVSTIGISAKVLTDPQIVKDPLRLKNYAEIISEQNNRIGQQIEKVLQIARLEKNKFSLKTTEINFHDLLTELCNSFETTIENSKGKLNLELEATTPIIRADKDHLSNIIFNLLDNSVKYSHNEPEIVISTYQSKNKLFASFTDNGIGIDKKLHQKIFEKFYRVPTGNIHNVKGFGIGLNYVKSIVKSHGWDIKLQSEPGKGSTFTLIIPIEN